MKTRQHVSTLLATIAALTVTAMAGPAMAHEGECPYCQLKLVQNTKTEDNEVVLKFGKKRIEYRCVYCVFKDQGRYKGDLVVYAPSEKVGEPVVLKRTDGKWTAPEGTVFLNTFKSHTDCAALSRAFTNREAFDSYVQAKSLPEAKAHSLDEFIAVVTKPSK